MLSESLPNGASGEKNMPQPGAPLEYHLVRNVSESRSNGASGEKNMHQPDEPETTIWWGFWKNHYLEKQIYPTTKMCNHLSQPAQTFPWWGFSTRCGPHSSKHINPPVIDPLALQLQVRMPRALQVLKSSRLNALSPQPLNALDGPHLVENP